MGKTYATSTGAILEVANTSVWGRLRSAAAAAAEAEPMLASLMHTNILQHDRLSSAFAYVLALKLASADLTALAVREIAEDALRSNPNLLEAMERDIEAVAARDPACRSLLQPFLFFKGFHALQSHRLAHWLWRQGRDNFAFLVQSHMSERFGVDIHPAAQIGSGVFIDHATGIVIGETSTVGDDVSMLHGVTLGGTGAERGDRHPKVGKGVLLGAGAKVLGALKIGDYARIAAGSVVLRDVAAHCTVAGVPAKVVKCDCPGEPAATMDHRISTSAEVE